MAKNLKLNIKNIQLAKATGLEKLKAKLAGEKAEEEKPKKDKEVKPKTSSTGEEEKPLKRRAKTKSAFAPKEPGQEENEEESEEEVASSSDLESSEEEAQSTPAVEEIAPPENVVQEEKKEEISYPRAYKRAPKEKPIAAEEETKKDEGVKENKVKLGPTGRHVKDLYTPKKEVPEPPVKRHPEEKKEHTPRPSVKKEGPSSAPAPKDDDAEKKGKKIRDFKDFKAPRKDMPQFDSRARQGLTQGDEERWRKRRPQKGGRQHVEEPVIRPTSLKIRLPITIKDLASEMKLKASELIQKLFMQGIVATLNDLLDDETIVQFIGDEFGCAIQIDTTEEQRIAVTSQSIQEEIAAASQENLLIRPPVVTFMGHVDHGKTSLIDAIRKSNRVAGEAGAITQHIGAFRCKTAVGDLTILDTPGHEAFSAMRARGASVTDIVVLVVAGDEGLREQTMEAINHAKLAKVTIVVAINKADKPNFNPENVYRQLAEIDLLPEVWGGQTITINTSAQTGQGIQELLEMLALQAEVLHLKADPTSRARGTVVESELQKGLGLVARVLVQNGTLRQGDAIVLDNLSGKVKTMRDEFGIPLKEAGPSTPVEITGLSGLPKAGDTFIVVKSEKEARDIAEARSVGMKQKALAQKKAPVLDSLMQRDNKVGKKILKVILRADVQGSMEALKTALLKIDSQKAEVEIISTGVGDISESDVQLAAASNAIILGFHNKVESHAEPLIKQLGVKVRLHEIIYHAIDDVKAHMLALLDKIEEEKETGRATVQATFKASQLGLIAGCIVSEGIISRNNRVRLEREGKMIWKGAIGSLKRVKEDVKEVKKGIECGILLQNNNDVLVGDVIVSYETVYHTQEL